MTVSGRVGAGVLTVLFCSSPALAQQGDGTDVANDAHVFKPALVEATAERMAQLKVPPGFSVQPFATGLKNVRVLAVAPDGTVYASRRDQGDVIVLRDADHDGKADGAPLVVASRAGAHGLAIHDGQLYLVTVKEVFRAPINADGTVGPLQMLLGDLPDSGQHPNRTLAFGPDGMMYVSVGSTCNACSESNPENATLVRVAPDGKSRVIFASGLRNTIGFDWEPRTGELWGMDHGIDYLGSTVQPEELNHLRQGKQYGWPHIYGEGGENPQSTPPGGMTKAQWKSISDPMVLGYAAHAAPMQMVFYKGGQFPRDYTGDAFVTMRGSWNAKPAAGYEVVRVDFEGGQPRSITPFLTGFLAADQLSHFARPMGLAQLPDGSLLVGDDANGVIYRVAGPAGAARGKATGAVPAGPMLAQAKAGTGVGLAMSRIAAPQGSPITLTSPSITANGPMAPRLSEYHDGVAPALSWTAVGGARSYALIMEDPDSKPITPFVHWVAWNIPGDVHSLPEGLQEQMRLTEPDGMWQGQTSRGSVGYFGPRPLVGDKPHHYHFQIFALDAPLSLPPGSDRDALLQAMKGHVLGAGELVGIYQQSAPPLK